MTQKFTTPCFIRKNDPELRKKLEELGYYPHPSEKKLYEQYPNYVGPSLHTGRGFYAIMQIGYDEEVRNEIDCETNESRFLALAALREDNDYMQFFTNGEEFILCDKKSWLDGKIPDLIHKRDLSIAVVAMLYNYHKATVEEIIEHFKNK